MESQSRRAFSLGNNDIYRLPTVTYALRYASFCGFQDNVKRPAILYTIQCHSNDHFWIDRFEVVIIR